jgi:tRNA (guanosine-2'-O-)-methyltransferase
VPDKSSELPPDLWKLLASQLTEKRRFKMEETASQRTERIRLVLQDIHHPHNVSACLRSAEAFGILNVHVINRTEPFKASSVAKGVDRWLNVHKHTDIPSCVAELKKRNYKIASAMPNPVDCKSLYDLPVDEPIAVLFGNEHEGMSEDFRPHVDYFFTIPMYGMVESLNISVCAAITMHELRHRAEIFWKSNFHLSESERTALLNTWIAAQYPRWSELYPYSSLWL